MLIRYSRVIVIAIVSLYQQFSVASNSVLLISRHTEMQIDVECSAMLKDPAHFWSTMQVYSTIPGDPVCEGL